MGWSAVAFAMDHGRFGWLRMEPSPRCGQHHVAVALHLAEGLAKWESFGINVCFCISNVGCRI